MPSAITNVEDLRRLAERRVPRMFYDYADSGSWTEGTYRSNTDDFASIKLRQRVVECAPASGQDQAAVLTVCRAC